MTFQINTINQQKEVLIMRVPEYVFNEFQSAQDYSSIGTLHFDKEIIKSVSFSQPVKEKRKRKQARTAPREFSVRMSKQRSVLHVLQEKNKKQYSIQGTCSEIGFLQPTNLNKFAELTSKRSIWIRPNIQSTEIKSTNIKPLTMKEMVNQNKTLKEKRYAMDEKELQYKLLGLFKEKEFWELKKLNEMLNQPERHLKTVLSNIAKTHKSGELRGLWELKEQYKQY
ncbi:general transcription factor iif subunit [Anaeramoeba flamelloides]|uniref:General transcription factor iif subunit n=1 Tax=Anaeramoeba flamelloides TaxID=1746091 RepID=A0AAV7YVY0_9EUKA|nr:general transcription factor iif subunit [Anaeramoeba flamelloides]